MNGWLKRAAVGFFGGACPYKKATLGCVANGSYGVLSPLVTAPKEPEWSRCFVQ